MKTNKSLRFETLAVHAGHGIDPSTGAVVDPINLSTTFERDVDELMHDTTAFHNEEGVVGKGPSFNLKDCESEREGVTARVTT
jgi:O-acetylhomoserine/O-acetylserine sulfhydrylase-like pyridoxal-dependent enzyme